MAALEIKFFGLWGLSSPDVCAFFEFPYEFIIR